MTVGHLARPDGPAGSHPLSAGPEPKRPHTHAHTPRVIHGVGRPSSPCASQPCPAARPTPPHLPPPGLEAPPTPAPAPPLGAPAGSLSPAAGPGRLRGLSPHSHLPPEPGSQLSSGQRWAGNRGPSWIQRFTNLARGPGPGPGLDRPTLKTSEGTKGADLMVGGSHGTWGTCPLVGKDPYSSRDKPSPEE